MIEFTPTPQQLAIRSLGTSFSSSSIALSASLPPSPESTTQKSRFQALRPLYRHAVDLGFLRAQIPPALGGTGGTLLDAAILVEEMYKSCDRSLALTIFGTGLGLSPLLLGGSPEQLQEHLEVFLQDPQEGEGESLASLVFSEPGGTANWLEKGGKGLGTVARRDGEGWVRLINLGRS